MNDNPASAPPHFYTFEEWVKATWPGKEFKSLAGKSKQYSEIRAQEEKKYKLYLAGKAINEDLEE